MQRFKAFTLLELLVVISIIGLLIGILVPILSSVRATARNAQCLNHLRQIAIANEAYVTDNRGNVVPMWIADDATGWASWDYDADTFVVQSPAQLWWTDKLRIKNYITQGDVYNCPSLSQPATQSGGGSRSTVNALGIGMNYPEFAVLSTGSSFTLPTYRRSNAYQVQKPSQFMILGDAAAITDPNEADADAWAEVPATGTVFLRVPSDTHSYGNGDSRAVPRHDQQVNAAFLDGHAKSLANSDFGFDLPRTDRSILWARNNNSLQP